MQQEAQTTQRVLKYKHVFCAYPVAFNIIFKRRNLLVAFGELNIWLRPDGVYCGNMNRFLKKYQYYNDSAFYKLEYQNSISYITEGVKGGFVCSTFQKGDPKMEQYQDLIKKVGPVYPLSKGMQDPFFVQKINFHCPDIQEREIFQQGFLSAILKYNGKFINYISRSLEQLFGPSYVNDTLKDKVINLFKNSWTAIKNKFRRAQKPVEFQIQQQQQKVQ